MKPIKNRRTFEEGDEVIVKGVEREGTVNKRRGDFYNVTLDATGEKKEKNVFGGDMVKASVELEPELWNDIYNNILESVVDSYHGDPEAVDSDLLYSDVQFFVKEYCKDKNEDEIDSYEMEKYIKNKLDYDDYLPDEIESSKTIKSAKSEEEYEQAVIEIADFFGVNANGSIVPIGREVTDIDYENGLDDICRKYDVSLKRSKFNSNNYIVSSKQIKSSVEGSGRYEIYYNTNNSAYTRGWDLDYPNKQDSFNSIDEIATWMYDNNCGYGLVDENEQPLPNLTLDDLVEAANNADISGGDTAVFSFEDFETGEKKYTQWDPDDFGPGEMDEDGMIMASKKQIKSSKYDDLFDLCRWDMLEHTVFLDRDQCKESKLGMSDLIDLLNEVAPYWAGVDNLEKLKDVCRKAKNPTAKARLEMLETAEDNARFTDKFYKSFNVHKKIASRYYMDNSRKFTLSEVAQYLSSLFFDLRTIHFLTTGSEFYTYHELAQTLYEKTEDYYDDIVETAITFDSDVSPMYVLPGDWQFVDENGSFDTNGQVTQTLILQRLQIIYDVLENVAQYDSMVQSKIDGMMEFYNKEIYKLTQALK